MGGQEPSPEGGGVDVVEASLNIQEEGGDLYPGSLLQSSSLRVILAAGNR